MAGIGSDGGPRASTQGSCAKAPTQMPYGVGAPTKVDSAPLPPQDKRGYAANGHGGSGTTANRVPQEGVKGA